MPKSTTRLVPEWMQGYDRRYLGKDVIAGATLSAVAIPEVLGYTTISQTPLATGLYTIIFPTMVFALLCSSRMLVVGADSATAALMAAGLLGFSTVNLTPYSKEWVAYASMVAIVTAVLLLLARLARARVPRGLPVGVRSDRVPHRCRHPGAERSDPRHAGDPQGHRKLVRPAVGLDLRAVAIQWETFAFAVATVVIILGLQADSAPRIPGALVAVVVLTTISSSPTPRSTGSRSSETCRAGFHPSGSRQGSRWIRRISVFGISLSCLILIIAQSAATSRSFAMKHGDKVDINRDIVGLSRCEPGRRPDGYVRGQRVADQDRDLRRTARSKPGRQPDDGVDRAGLHGLLHLGLADMPKAVLAGIVFLIGVGLIDRSSDSSRSTRKRQERVLDRHAHLRRGLRRRRRAGHHRGDRRLASRHHPTPVPAQVVRHQRDPGRPARRTPKPAGGVQSEPGLVVFRYDAELFYANANRFVEDVQDVVEGAPRPRPLGHPRHHVDHRPRLLGVEQPEGARRLPARQGDPLRPRPGRPDLVATLATYGYPGTSIAAMTFATVDDAIAAFRASTPCTVRFRWYGPRNLGDVGQD